MLFYKEKKYVYLLTLKWNATFFKKNFKSYLFLNPKLDTYQL